VRGILLEKNRPKENFYTAKSMMKPIGQKYQKIDMCLNFCVLYFFKNVKLTECRTYVHARYKSRTSRGRTLITHRKLRYFLITPRLQMLFISPYTIEYITWHHSYDAVNEWWCTIPMVKPINILIGCILSF
jgi:hypothetical protein